MSLKAFEDLMLGVSKKLNISLSPDKSLGCQIYGKDFLIVYGFNRDPEGMYIYCYVGKPSIEQECELLKELLQMNLLTFGDNTPSFGYDSDNDCLMLTLRMGLPTATIEKVINALLTISGYVNSLSEKYIITNKLMIGDEIEEPPLVVNI